jgi:hypothetical protein
MENNNPTHNGYIVVDAPEGSDKKPQWFQIAPGWFHGDKQGLDLIIPPGVTVTGRIVIRLNKPREA